MGMLFSFPSAKCDCCDLLLWSFVFFGFYRQSYPLIVPKLLVERYLAAGELSLGVLSSSYTKQLMMSPQRNSWILKHNSSFGVVEEVMNLLNHSRGTQKSFLNTIPWE